MICGVIIEANPLHNGHQKLVDYIKNTLNPECLIAVTSTVFSMRGAISPLTKKEKTRLLLEAGFDLVIELPIEYTIVPGDEFAKNAINILYQLSVDTICFGAEVTDINIYENVYNITKTSKYKELLKYHQKELHKSLKISYIDTLLELADSSDYINDFVKSNTQLGFSYYKAIKNLGYNINIHIMKRVEEIDFYNPSARLLYKMILNMEDVSDYLPFDENFIDLNFAEKCLNAIIANETGSGAFGEPSNKDIPEDLKYLLSQIYNYNLGLQNVLFKPSSNYTYSRLRRLVLSKTLKIDTSNHDNATYLRMLGLNDTGSSYISKLPIFIKDAIFASPSEFKKNELPGQYIYEYAAVNLYQAISGCNNIVSEEFEFPVKKVE